MTNLLEKIKEGFYMAMQELFLLIIESVTKCIKEINELRELIDD